MRQTIAHSGLNLNGVYFTKEALRKAVKDSKKNLPIMFEYRHNEPIGFVENLKYEDGKVTANIKLNTDKIDMKNKVVRLASRAEKIINRKNHRTIEKMSIEFCGLIEKENDAERDLR